MSVQPTEASADPLAQVPTGAGALPGGGSRWMMGGFAVFVAWAVLVPLDSAVIANGHLMSAGHNRIVQHLSGGTIRAIHAREGMQVEKGEVLLELEPLVDAARLERLRARRAALQAIEGRLVAERSLSDSEDPRRASLTAISLLDLRLGDTNLLRLASHSNAPTLETTLEREQEREFLRGRRAMVAQVAALERRAAAEEARRDGLDEQIARNGDLISMLEKRTEAIRDLAEKGFASRRQLWDSEGQMAEQRSQLARLTSEALALDQTIAEIAADIERIRESDARDNSQRLTEVISELASIGHEISAAEQALGQTRIVAPADGHLVRFAANTPGAVVRGGETLGELVPSGTKLVVRGKVSPEDIVAIRLGQPADVHVTALPSRIADPVAATVTFVANDATSDERSGARFFEIEAELDLAGRADVSAMLTPGMSAQVFFKGTARTFAGYLGQPLVEALRQTFRER